MKLNIVLRLFEPSDVLDEPYVIVCLNTIVAENDDEAQYLASSMAQINDIFCLSIAIAYSLGVNIFCSSCVGG
jgi:alkanesulfonate monooxygenase SsuD/methylene tetrahydromethanopterin reductase-like flavin-dependent oxidoreductase (luciferase family)